MEMEQHTHDFNPIILKTWKSFGIIWNGWFSYFVYLENTKDFI